jgi:chemotaxis protein MotB
LLAEARRALAAEEEISAQAQRQTELLNQQVAALRTQLGDLQALLDDARERDAAQQVQLQSLGSELNTALARVAAEERRRAQLEEAERKRLEAEAARLAAETERLSEETKDLEQYRSEFFGRLREVLGTQEGVRIEGDRFVFSSEILFELASATLSAVGQEEVAKVARIISSVADEIPPEIDWIIRVDGHTDNLPLSGTGEFADNWELSQGRALSVVKYMVNALGIPPERLSANGFGEYQPVAIADTPEARAQNRRIELKFTER